MHGLTKGAVPSGFQNIGGGFKEPTRRSMPSYVLRRRVLSVIHSEFPVMSLGEFVWIEDLEILMNNREA